MQADVRTVGGLQAQLHWKATEQKGDEAGDCDVVLVER